MHIEKTVFISYRRTNAPWALAIFQYLTHHGYDVFFDFTGIASGDFERAILEHIQARAHFLILLTPSALDGCRQPGDWLRREIETALAMRRNVVPLMLEGFDFNTPGIAQQLTGAMAPLKHYNALRVPVEYFDEAMSRLCNRFLNVPLAAVLHPVSPPAQRVTVDQQRAAAAAPAVQERQLTAQEYFERGFAAGDLDEQRRFYSQALDLQPDFVSALNNRGVVRRMQGDFAGAREDFDNAIGLNPGDPELFTNRAALRQTHGDPVGAREDYDTAIRLDPGFSSAFFNRAVLRQSEGDVAGAREDYDTAIRLNPHDPDPFNNRAVLRKAQGDPAGAREDYDMAILLKSDDAAPFNNRAVLRASQGDLAGARDDYDTAIRLDPDIAEHFNNRGLLRKSQGDLSGAREDYDAAIRLNPGYANAFNNRSVLRKAQGDPAGARADQTIANRLKQDVKDR